MGTSSLHRGDGTASIVLIVDDDFDTCAIVSEYLSAHGAKTIAVSEVPAALLVVSTLRVDAILTDFVMPEMDGLTFLRALREDPAHRATPVIMITGHAARDELEGAAEALGARFLEKPIELPRLLDALGQSLRGASPRRADPLQADRKRHAQPRAARIARDVVAASEQIVQASRATLEAARRSSRRRR